MLRAATTATATSAIATTATAAVVTAAAVAALLSTAAAPATAAPPGAAGPRPPSCAPGEFCVWAGEDYGGARRSWELTAVSTGECVPFPDGFDARSLANHTGRRVTVYQSRECATEAEFETLPKFAADAPRLPYLVRAVQLQE